MKIKLIQSGGFMGRTKTAEEEVSFFSPEFQKFLENTFVHTPTDTSDTSPGASRDTFDYFLEYNGKALPLHVIPPSPAFDQLLKSLKAKLHY